MVLFSSNIDLKIIFCKFIRIVKRTFVVNPLFSDVQDMRKSCVNYVQVMCKSYASYQQVMSKSSVNQVQVMSNS